MSTDNPIVVVTTSFENPIQLKRTLNSVINQTEQPGAHLVIDSSSGMNAKSIRDMTLAAGAQLVWVPPRGPYRAMNRALDFISPNQYGWFVNSSDMIAHPRSISLATHTIQEVQADDPKWLIGGLYRATKEGVSVHKIGPHRARFIARMIRGATGFPHPSVIMKAGFLQSQGGYSEKYEIAADYAMGLLSAENLGLPINIDYPLGLHFPGGISYKRPVRNFLEKARARFEFLDFPKSVLANLIALGYGARGALRRLSLLPEPRPPKHFIEALGSDDHHFCGVAGGSWPKCCVAYLDKQDVGQR